MFLEDECRFGQYFEHFNIPKHSFDTSYDIVYIVKQFKKCCLKSVQDAFIWHYYF